ncbi:MAG: shikimate dehydrogenase [Clostridia bacterium]|nr:shikimate dehydrogenase [Clostridia bacterium]
MLNLAVIGDPISHSCSLQVHGAAFSALGIPCSYERIRVKKGELQSFLDYAIEKGLNGFNLTMPHKVDILPYLSGMDDAAKRFGAVNTVLVKEGKLYGFNTDAEGYIQAVSDAGCQVKDSNVLILGAGGVVRTLALALKDAGAKKIRILNRTLEKAEEIAEPLSGIGSAGTLKQKELCESCQDCQILVQATPLGMHGVKEDFSDLTFLECLPKNAMVTDLIYNPPKTALLAKAEELGLSTLNGMGMLIYQALLADRIYTGTEFSLKLVYEEVKKVMMP